MLLIVENPVRLSRIFLLFYKCVDALDCAPADKCCFNEHFFLDHNSL